VAAAARTYPNVMLADWLATIAPRTGLLWGDGVHPRPAGARLYAGVVAAAVQATRPATASAPRRAWGTRARRLTHGMARPHQPRAGRPPAWVAPAPPRPLQRGRPGARPPSEPPPGRPAGDQNADDQPGDGAPAAEMPYEQARDELIEVVRRLEGGGLTLEES